jgi:hypothetical protein
MLPDLAGHGIDHKALLARAAYLIPAHLHGWRGCANGKRDQDTGKKRHERSFIYFDVHKTPHMVLADAQAVNRSSQTRSRPKLRIVAIVRCGERLCGVASPGRGTSKSRLPSTKNAC